MTPHRRPSLPLRLVRPARLLLPPRWRTALKDWARRWPERRPGLARAAEWFTGGRPDPPGDLEDGLASPSAWQPNAEHPSPLVSVVIPCFNGGHFLPEALASVWTQTFRDVEVIVVDDGSTDGETLAALAGLSDPRVRVVRQENRGLAGARNTGFRGARGKYVCPLDADDLLAPTHLEKLLLAAESRQCAVAFSDVERFGAWEGVWRTGPFTLEALLGRNTLTCNALIRRDAWERAGGYHEPLRHGYEDWELWIRMAAAGHRAVKVPEPLFRYRRHGASLLSVTNRRQTEVIAAIRAMHSGLFARPREAAARVAASERMIAAEPFINLTPERHAAAPGDAELAVTPRLDAAAQEMLVCALGPPPVSADAPGQSPGAWVYHARPMLPPEHAASLPGHLARVHRVASVRLVGFGARQAERLAQAIDQMVPGIRIDFEPSRPLTPGDPRGEVVAP